MTMHRIQTSSGAVVAVLAAVSICGAQGACAADAVQAKPAPAPAAVDRDAASYDVGLMLGGQLEHGGLGSSVSLDGLVRGLKDSLAGRAITPPEHEAALAYLHEAREAMIAKNRAEG